MGGGAGGLPTPGRTGDRLSELTPPAASATLSLLALWLLLGVFGSSWRDNLLHGAYGHQNCQNKITDFIFTRRDCLTE